ncbi:BLUF domain-containing protein [Stenotrophomonas chelatiphaga]|uniref:BLUF domain-containing protein n=1 Tax=Stenotrophomonas chelatiphaga TaxID=517011 RepID=UPI003D0DE221
MYISQAAGGLTEGRLHALAASAATFNRLAGVTGVLLTDGARFFQYFEGPHDGVDAVYGRVRSSSSHRGLTEISSAVVKSRQLPHWEMHAIAVEGEAIDRLVAACWEEESVDAKAEKESGMKVISDLLDLPRSSTRG